MDYLEVNTLLGDEVFFYFFAACNLIALGVWILTLVTDKHSFMDKLWPILPSVYAWAFVWAAYDAKSHPGWSKVVVTRLLPDTVKQGALTRVLIITGLLTMWSMRLAYVFWRRGFYTWNFEDHRWELVKKRFGYPEKKIPFHIFNFVFMAFVQNWILFGYSLPIWYLLTNKSTQTSLNIFDYIVIIMYVVFYLIEAIADEQQWRFQSNKHKWLADKSLPYSAQEIEDFERGFLCRGLFAYSRHPNYFGDILLWWSVYLFTISSKYTQTGNVSFPRDWLNYSMLAAALMTYFFQRSVSISEKVTSSRYPQYKDYKAKVNRILIGFSAYVPKKN